MPKFNVPVTWQMSGYEIVADSKEKAAEEAYKLPLPDGDLVKKSLEVREDEIELVD